MLKSAQLVRMKIEAKDQAEELKMADGTMVKTEGRVSARAQVWWVQSVKFPPGYFPIWTNQ